MESGGIPYVGNPHLDETNDKIVAISRQFHCVTDFLYYTGFH